MNLEKLVLKSPGSLTSFLQGSYVTPESHSVMSAMKRHKAVPVKLIFLSCPFFSLFVLSHWQKEPGHTTTWPTANWSTCWCNARRSWRGRRRSMNVRNFCWPSGRRSWRNWSRRSKIWRTTLTHCWCASWSRSPPSCKCAPNSSDEFRRGVEGLQFTLHLFTLTSTTAL